MAELERGLFIGVGGLPSNLARNSITFAVGGRGDPCTQCQERKDVKRRRRVSRTLMGRRGVDVCASVLDRNFELRPEQSVQQTVVREFCIYIAVVCIVERTVIGI